MRSKSFPIYFCNQHFAGFGRSESSICTFVNENWQIIFNFSLSSVFVHERSISADLIWSALLLISLSQSWITNKQMQKVSYKKRNNFKLKKFSKQKKLFEFT